MSIAHTKFSKISILNCWKLEPSLQRRRQYAKQLKRKIFIMDGSVIPLSLSLFDWAKFRTKKGAIKMWIFRSILTPLIRIEKKFRSRKNQITSLTIRRMLTPLVNKREKKDKMDWI